MTDTSSLTEPAFCFEIEDGTKFFLHPAVLKKISEPLHKMTEPGENTDGIARPRNADSQTFARFAEYAYTGGYTVLSTVEMPKDFIDHKKDFHGLEYYFCRRCNKNDRAWRGCIFPYCSVECQPASLAVSSSGSSSGTICVYCVKCAGGIPGVVFDMLGCRVLCLRCEEIQLASESNKAAPNVQKPAGKEFRELNPRVGKLTYAETRKKIKTLNLKDAPSSDLSAQFRIREHDF